MSETPIHFQTVAALARRIRSGETGPVALTEHFLDRIARLDPKLTAYRLVTRERALAQARAAETELRAGIDRGPLHGIPYAAKDLFDVRGLPTTAGTRLRADALAGADSTATRNLERAGMVLLGKTNTVQFAYAGVGMNSDHGTPRNPWTATPHVPGGSSSGSGVAVASGLVPAALGTDTGGSVRIPAALCGIVGLKTTVGRVSRAGVYPLSHSLDSVGPLARSVEDAALLYQQLCGEDDADETTHGVAPDDALRDLRAGVKGLRLAFAESAFFDDVDPEIAQAVREAGRVLRDLGAQVESVAFPEAAEAVKLNPRGLVIAAEAYAVNRAYVEGHFDELDPLVRERLRKGADIPGPEYFETTRRWSALRRQADRALAHLDALLVPATMIPAVPTAPLAGDLDAYVRVNLKYLRNTTIGNVLRLCGLSVPCGFTRQGLPIGLMIYGRGFTEATVLRVGHAYEQATPWHERRPDLTWAS
jgi:aspartyl-tRNA(Asn)/glutamyl-tRNA(Gln) amidotransferase subunit A